MPRRSPSAQLADEVNYLFAPLRIVLVNFAILTPLYDRLANEHRLKDMGKECIPVLLQRFKDILGTAWTKPRILLDLHGVSATVQADMENAGVPWGLISEYVLGAKPLCMEVATLLTPSAIIGVFKTKEDNYLLRLRHGYAGLKLSYLFSQVIAQGMRQQGCPEILFLDKGRNQSGGQGNPAKGAVKGKGTRQQGKREGSTKGKQPGKRGLAPVGAPAQAAPAAPAAAAVEAAAPDLGNGVGVN